MRKIRRPSRDEYPEYSQVYMDLVKTDDDILSELRANSLLIREFISGLPEEKLTERYADGKWTIKEILVHLIECAKSGVTIGEMSTTLAEVFGEHRE